MLELASAQNMIEYISHQEQSIIGKLLRNAAELLLIWVCNFWYYRSFVSISTNRYQSPWKLYACPTDAKYPLKWLFINQIKHNVMKYRMHPEKKYMGVTLELRGIMREINCWHNSLYIYIYLNFVPPIKKLYRRIWITGDIYPQNYLYYFSKYSIWIFKVCSRWGIHDKTWRLIPTNCTLQI